MGKIKDVTRDCHGFTLIEVLIAVLILSIGLLGLGAMQMKALNSSSSAHLKSVSTFLAYDMADRMRANRDQVLAGQYSASLGVALTAPSPNCISASCSPGQLTAFDVWEWKEDLKDRLPGGDGAITRLTAGGLNRYQIQVQWIESYDDSGSGSMEHDYITFQTEM